MTVCVYSDRQHVDGDSPDVIPVLVAVVADGVPV